MPTDPMSPEETQPHHAPPMKPNNEQPENMLTIKPLTGKWRTRCCVCGTEYENGCGSTPCCGSIQEIIKGSHQPEESTPPPSEPLGVAAVTERVHVRALATGIDPSTLDQWPAFSAWHKDHEGFDPHPRDSRVRMLFECWAEADYQAWERFSEQPASPTREPAEGASALWEAIKETIWHGKTSVGMAYLDIYATRIAEAHNSAVTDLETALAEAKARLAEAQSEVTRLTKYGEGLRMAVDGYHQQRDALTAQLAELKAAALNIEADRDMLDQANIETVEKLSAANAENERLAALVEEYREQTGCPLCRAAHAQIAAMWPKASDEEAKIGWRWSFKFLELIHDRMEMDSEDRTTLEAIDSILTVLHALSPSCGAELLQKLASLEQQAAYDNEAIERMQRVGAENEVKIADLTARNAKLEGFVKDCANDDLDRVSGGIKQAARQAIDSAPEGRGA